jgi:YegS/Rv2252/BmrU family lipid kinase
MSPPYPRIHVVINPASGKDQPILNTLNDVFVKHGVDWSVTITKRYGDAETQARQAFAEGADLVAACGGDGTQHEVALAALDADRPLGILPGGTGNGFARENGIPSQLAPAVELLCTSRNVRRVDAARVGKSYFIQRMYVGIEPEEQTSRELKNKYGVLAYAVTTARRVRTSHATEYQLTIDGQQQSVRALQLYVVNSGMTGKGVAPMGEYSITDGLLEVIVLSSDPLSILAAEQRMFHLPLRSAALSAWRGRKIALDAESPRTVWTDGEMHGKTPVTVEVVPAALPVVVP